MQKGDSSLGSLYPFPWGQMENNSEQPQNCLVISCWLGPTQTVLPMSRQHWSGSLSPFSSSNSSQMSLLSRVPELEGTFCDV